MSDFTITLTDTEQNSGTNNRAWIEDNLFEPFNKLVVIKNDNEENEEIIVDVDVLGFAFLNEVEIVYTYFDKTDIVRYNISTGKHTYDSYNFCFVENSDLYFEETHFYRSFEALFSHFSMFEKSFKYYFEAPVFWIYKLGNRFLNLKPDKVKRFGAYLVPQEWDLENFPEDSFGCLIYNIYTQNFGFVPGQTYNENDFVEFNNFFLPGVDMEILSNVSSEIPDREELQNLCHEGIERYREKIKTLQELVLTRLKNNIYHKKKTPDQILKNLIYSEVNYQRLCIELTQQVSAFGLSKQFVKKRPEFSIKNYALKDYFTYGLISPDDYSYLDENIEYLKSVWKFTPKEISEALSCLFEPVDFMSSSNQIVLKELLDSKFENKKEILKDIIFFFSKNSEGNNSERYSFVLYKYPELYTFIYNINYSDIFIKNAKLLLQDKTSFMNYFDELYNLQIDTFKHLSDNVWNRQQNSPEFMGRIVDPNEKQYFDSESSYDGVSSYGCPDTRYYSLSIETQEELERFIIENECYVIFKDTMSVIGFFSFEKKSEGDEDLDRNKHINRFWLSSFYRSWHNNASLKLGVPELTLSCYITMQDSSDISFSVDLPYTHERVIRWAKRMGFLSTDEAVLEGYIRYKGKLENTFMV